MKWGEDWAAGLSASDDDSDGDGHEWLKPQVRDVAWATIVSLSLSLSLCVCVCVCVCVFFFLWLPGTGSDLEATWDSIMKNLDQTAPLFSLAGVHGTGAERAGGWNDPDM